MTPLLGRTLNALERHERLNTPNIPQWSATPSALWPGGLGPFAQGERARGSAPGSGGGSGGRTGVGGFPDALNGDLLPWALPCLGRAQARPPNAP